LNNEDRSHSFKRSEPTPSRELEDGLWNSPVRNTVGSFDSNGVFRVMHDTSDSPALSADRGPSPASDQAQVSSKAAGPGTISSSGASPAPTAASAILPEPEPKDGLVLKELDDDSAFSFPGSNSNAKAGVSSSDLNSLPTTRDEPDFAPFNSASAQLSSFGAAPAPALEPQPPMELSKWLYRDPAGNIQGPFLSEEMHEWYKGGFFSMDLMVKREQDPAFEPLGSLIRRIGSDDNPFLLAGALRLDSTPVGRPTISLPQARQFGQSSWGGLSAPTTPSASGFGVDRLFMQQQSQQHSSSGDLFAGSMQQQQQQQQQQQRSDFPGQDVNASAPFAGFDQKWNSGGFFGPSRGMDSSTSWSGDALGRSPLGGMGGVPQSPLGGGFGNQQQRFMNQHMERQHLLQMIQHQAQMQRAAHHQQFMNAQQQFGSDPHALAAMLSQQHFQMRQQQIHQGPFQGQGVSSPGGSMLPWGAGGLGQQQQQQQQPGSPWSSSIIQSNTDNYFDFNNGSTQGLNRQEQLLQQQQQQQQQQAMSQHEHSLDQAQQDQQQDQLESQPHLHEEHVAAPVESDDSLKPINDKLQQIMLEEKSMPTELVESHFEAVVATTAASHEAVVVTEEIHSVVDYALESKTEELSKMETTVEQSTDVLETETLVNTYESVTAVEEEAQEEMFEEEETTQFVEDSQVYSSNDVDEEESSFTSAQPTPEPRPIKSVPAPWAKATKVDDSEKKGPTLREIQEMEAKRADELRAVERQTLMAAAANNAMDFAKGLSVGGSPWQTSSAPKKKTLREIQQEEEVALQRSRSAQASAVAATTVAGSPTVSAALALSSGSTSVGLAGIVAAGTSGSSSKRYADTIGPKPVSTPSMGVWGSSASAAAVAARPASVSRSSSVVAISPVQSSSPSMAAKTVDTSSWVEVDSKRSLKATAAAAAVTDVPLPSVSRPTTTISSTTTVKSNAVSNATVSYSDEPRPPSEDFMRWCRQALKGLQGVVLDDFIQMLLSFPLNPDPMTVEIIQDSIYANSQSLDGRRFADEFVKRRKVDAQANHYSFGGAYGIGGGASSSSLLSSSSSLAVGVGAGAGTSGSVVGSDSSFKVVSKKNKKKNVA
ncbi:hypothetical protein BGW38_003450, partial [Lunasporangiospora selenospora]